MTDLYALQQRYVLNRCIYIVAFVELSLLLAGCGCQGNRMTVNYIIPDGYEGHLAIRYECPGGERLPMRNGELWFRLGSDGTACIADSLPPTCGEIFAWSTNGTPIPVTTAPWEGNGYTLFLQGALGTSRNNVDYSFELMWIGDMQQLREDYESSIFGLQQAIFLEQRFGLEHMGTP
ncbi:hypothetical protein [Kallotenue papyrolyticum]|uniref:hypothetical protein n=1 Tax=Kallotenue papyrolyticum TaxID=1325125 RepID=UPI001268A573|nr:hypothetical protein [Kallotenue papyrolyticum]